KISSILKASVQALTKNDTIDTALLLMQEHAISSVVIIDEQEKPIGIFTERDSLYAIANNTRYTSTLAEAMTKDVFSVFQDSYIHDAYILMERKEYRHIVVVDKNNVFKGVVTEGDFLRHMGFEDVIQEKNISQAMSESILTISADTSILETAKLMSAKKCDYAIVIKDNKPSLIVTERDITLYCANHSLEKDTKISALDTQKMYTVDKDKSLQEASSLMQQHSIHQLIVTNKNKELIGLISRHDILKAVHGAYFNFLLRTIDEKTKKENKLKEQALALKKLANYDLLTQLPNRLLFKKFLQKSIANAIRNQYSIAVIIFDIDRFRDINDSYGHIIGDELLSKIAIRLTKQIREGDVIARLGGNEFAIILEYIKDENTLPRLIQKYLNALSQTIYLSNSTEVSVEACAGIVLAPRDSQDVDQTIQFVNSALHQAKAEGHGIYKFYTTEFLEKSLEKIAYENALRNALKNKELELYYQPQVHMQTGKIVGVEALLRWKTKDGTMIPPSVFIPIADESGLINEIGEWILFEACRQGKIWMDAGYHITVAINVSANQVKYQDLPSLVSKALLETGYNPHKLEIEITESALMQREEETVKMLYSLRAKGIKLAIDDFGTGYSSLSYLKRFPIDVLKIDKSFIDDIPFEEDDCAIVTAIIEMGKALGYQILAEGTEKQEQLDFLEKKGCHMYQGYIKSKALPAKEFEALFQAQNS
ncbi:MAG: EAL domain-containing protein, partial [Helicobacteraceae bacterium]|nr:EAL domain-containing protein [Candidatus Sulfurimonas ponti]